MSDDFTNSYRVAREMMRFPFSGSVHSPLIGAGSNVERTADEVLGLVADWLGEVAANIQRWSDRANGVEIERDVLVRQRQAVRDFLGTSDAAEVER